MKLLGRKGSLAILAAAVLLGFSTLGLAELSVTLTDGSRDDVELLVREMGPEAPVGGYVEWVVTVSGPAQEIALKNTLMDCMRLMAGTTGSGGRINGGNDPNVTRRQVAFNPGQPDAIVTAEGNTLIIENIEIPDSGTLEIRYWAEIVGYATYRYPRLSPDGHLPLTAGVQGVELTAVQIDPVGGTAPVRRSLTDRFSDQSAGTNLYDVTVPERQTVWTSSTSSMCCNQVKVVDGEVRLHLSQDDPGESLALLCAEGASGFHVATDYDNLPHDVLSGLVR